MSAKNILLTSVGVFLLIVGLAGLFVPILPTMPFILVAYVCFNGNPRIRARLLRNKVFQKYLENYQRNPGVKKTIILMGLWPLWGTLWLSMVAVNRLWSTILLTCVGIVATIRLLSMTKSLKGS